MTDTMFPILNIALALGLLIILLINILRTRELHQLRAIYRVMLNDLREKNGEMARVAKENHQQFRAAMAGVIEQVARDELKVDSDVTITTTILESPDDIPEEFAQAVAEGRGIVLDLTDYPSGKCELCTEEADELRPYGPNDEHICIDCARKDPEVSQAKYAKDMSVRLRSAMADVHRRRQARFN